MARVVGADGMRTAAALLALQKEEVDAARLPPVHYVRSADNRADDGGLPLLRRTSLADVGHHALPARHAADLGRWALELAVPGLERPPHAVPE